MTVADGAVQGAWEGEARWKQYPSRLKGDGQPSQEDSQSYHWEARRLWKVVW